MIINTETQVNYEMVEKRPDSELHFQMYVQITTNFFYYLLFLFHGCQTVFWCITATFWNRGGIAHSYKDSYMKKSLLFTSDTFCCSHLGRRYFSNNG